MSDELKKPDKVKKASFLNRRIMSDRALLNWLLVILFLGVFYFTVGKQLLEDMWTMYILKWPGYTGPAGRVR